MAYNIDYEKDIIYNIDIDIHHKILIPTISAKQYDENARYLVFTVWDNGQPYVIPEGTTVMFCTTKPDLHGVANACEIINGKVVYKLTLQTTIIHGNFPAELRFYRTTLGESKAYATPDFNIHIGKSALLDDTILSSDEVNVLTELIADATEAIANMSTILVAESNRVAAENTRKTNETNRTTAESSRATVETARVAAENTRKTNETTRDTNETARKTSETGRVSVESARVTAETTRGTQETTRQSNESTRQSNETTRQSQETTRQNYYNAYKVLETYNNTKAYVVGNKVTYLGGSYQNILTSTGIPPTYNTDNANWKCTSAKGADGTGVGDMLSTTYDVNNKKTDIFAYVDNKTAISTDTKLGLVKGNGNVEVLSDGAMWANPYSDKATTQSGISITCPTSDDALVEITNITDIGESFTITSTNGIESDTLLVTYPYPTLPIYIKSFKGTTTVTTNAATKPTLTADFKSELWSRDYLQDKALNNALYMMDEIDTASTLLTDSELLGGKPKSYFEALVQAVSDRVTTNLASINAINNNVTFLTLKSPWEIYLSEPLLYVKAGKMRIISGTIYNPSATAANSQIAILPEVLNTARFSVYDKTPIRYSAHMSGTMLNMESTVPANSIINFIAIGYLT